jgi:hypothetical protein
MELTRNPIQKSTVGGSCDEDERVPKKTLQDTQKAEDHLEGPEGDG